MKSIEERNHYEILDIRKNCDRSEVEQAYRVATATYANNSMASYSLYTDDELEVVRARIDEAYRVLMGEDSRSAYDAGMQDNHLEADVKPSLRRQHRTSEALSPATEFVELGVDDHGPYRGARLRRLRLERGIELKHVSRMTKISGTHLRHIEEDRYDDLPAPVYVRGFVYAYARCLGLEAEHVADEYMDCLRAVGHRRSQE